MNISCCEHPMVSGWRRNERARLMRYASDMSSRRLPAADGALIQIADAALADAARRSGEWLVCRPGCTQCCVGVFAINQLDAIRLRKGLAELEQQDPQRAARIRERVNATLAPLSPDFPGDLVTGLLSDDDSDEACKQWDEYANDVPCPVLDPEKGTCELYE